MLRGISQSAALILFNLKTVPERKGSVAAAMVGIAGVVTVMVGVLSIGQGFRRVMATTGSPDTALVLRAGADTEMTSILGRDEVDLVVQAPGIVRTDGKPMASPELFVVVNLPKRSTGTDANVPLRGVEPTAFRLRDELQIVQGRMFEWGRNEVIAGRAATGEFQGLEIGNTLELGRIRWEVVGIFEANGGLEESEIWADAAVIQPAYRRGSSYQIVQTRLASAGTFQEFKDALTSDPRLHVRVVRETEYYAEQSRLLVRLVTGLGTLIAGLMGLGAVFGALNTMYTAVASRTREIATLRALGFPGLPVVISVLVESLVLAAIGGAAGALLAWAAFDGYRAATLNWQSFSQVAFAFRVGPELLAQGFLYALALGLVGGLFPAVRAVRVPVSQALREG